MLYLSYALLTLVITRWALDSYLDLKHRRVFTPQDDKSRLRPNVLALQDYPTGPRMQTIDFGPAQAGGRRVQHGFGSDAFLCKAYVKSSPVLDKKAVAELALHISKIQRGHHQPMGLLT